MLLGSAIVENVIGKVEQWYDGFCIQVSFRINFYYSVLKINVTWATGTLSLQAFAGRRSSYTASKNSMTDKTIREITVESLGLEPLCEEVKTYYFLKSEFLYWTVTLTPAVLSVNYGLLSYCNLNLYLSFLVSASCIPFGARNITGNTGEE